MCNGCRPLMKGELVTKYDYMVYSINGGGHQFAVNYERFHIGVSSYRYCNDGGAQVWRVIEPVKVLTARFEGSDK